MVRVPTFCIFYRCKLNLQILIGSPKQNTGPATCLGTRSVKVLDFYSGVGGWSLGMTLAELETVASYEWSRAANLTNARNNNHKTVTADLRALPLESLPGGVQVVVGSPPCTQFSFSNRGGSGDLKDGLVDIRRFFEIVERVQPKFWVMENVPRVAAIVEKELGRWGRLARFRHLGAKTAVFNLEDYGVPQRRNRCLIGNIDFELLQSYRGALPTASLGQVLKALDDDVIEDPVYGLRLPKAQLVDHDPEPFLNEEEARINKAAKVEHHIYNSMPFPDRLDRQARTVTATCTRVSRESIIVEDPGGEGVRRLTVRERATLQSFPITYRFYGSTYAEKLRMVGNAMPPAFAFLVGMAMQGKPASEIHCLSKRIHLFSAPDEVVPDTQPERAGRRYPRARTFRFAIPALRLKSGVRFELANRSGQKQGWHVDFYFGTSKRIHMMTPDRSQLQALRGESSAELDKVLDAMDEYLKGIDVARLQDVWSHHGPGGTRPLDLLDRLDTFGSAIRAAIENEESGISEEIVRRAVEDHFEVPLGVLASTEKIIKNATVIRAGLIVAAMANATLKPPALRTPAPSRRASA